MFSLGHPIGCDHSGLIPKHFGNRPPGSCCSRDLWLYSAGESADTAYLCLSKSSQNEYSYIRMGMSSLSNTLDNGINLPGWFPPYSNLPNSRLQIAHLASLVLVMVGCLQASLHAQTCDPTKPATLIVQVNVVNGQVRVDQSTAPEILGGDRLTRCLSSPNENLEKIKPILTKDLDDALASRPVFYCSTLDLNCTPKTKLEPCLSAPSQSWTDFVKCYSHWAGGDLQTRTALSAFFNSLVATDIGALNHRRSAAPAELADGKFRFDIIAPGVRWSDKLASPTAGVPVDRQTLIEYLNGLNEEDRLWRKTYIEQKLLGFFTRRGWSPHVNATPADIFKDHENPDAAKLTITIDAVLPVRQVMFMPRVPQPSHRERVLYLLLSTKDFARARTLPVVEKEQAKVPAQFIDLSPLKPHPPYFNQLAFTGEQQAVASLGFTVTSAELNETEPDKRGANLQVQQNSQGTTVSGAASTPTSLPSGKPVPKSTTAATSKPIKLANPARATNRAARQRPPVVPDCSQQTPGSEQACGPDPLPKDKKRFLGVGFDYLPGQGVRPLGAFEYQRLLGTGSVSVEGGSANQFLYLSGAASFDFIGFARLHHRLSLNLTGGSDVINNRLIGVQQLMERRNGGKGHLELEARRDPLGHSLSFYLEGGEQVVNLKNEKPTSANKTVLSDTLVSFDLGAVYTLARPDADRPYWLRFQPIAEVGHAASGWYALANAGLNYHKEFLDRLALELNARFEDSSRHTPVYQLPSFGGVYVVRGFRADDLLARRLWSIQPELWAPVPGTLDKGGEVGKLLSGLRLASFFDVGGVYQTLLGPPGTKAGPGAGLRFDLGPATLRCDWAYGLGDVASGPGHGRFYFSVSTPIL